MSIFCRVSIVRSSYSGPRNRVIVVMLIAAIYTRISIDFGPSYKNRDRFRKVSGWAKVPSFRPDPDFRTDAARTRHVPRVTDVPSVHHSETTGRGSQDGQRVISKAQNNH